MAIVRAEILMIIDREYPRLPEKTKQKLSWEIYTHLTQQTLWQSTEEENLERATKIEENRSRKKSM